MRSALITCLALAGAAPVAAQSQALEVTVLERVTLPWQSPEVILTAAADLPGAVEVDVACAGGISHRSRIGPLRAGQTRSVTFSAPEGTHRCTVRVSDVGPVATVRVARELQLEVVPELALQFGEADVDLGARRLRFRASRRPSFAELQVYDVDGELIHRSQTDFARSRRSYRVRWPALARHAARVELRVFTQDDAWADASWTPIDVELTGEPLLLGGTSGDTAVADAERLRVLHGAAMEALRKHHGVPGLSLYVLGEGPAANAKATARDADEVARYLARGGKLGVPVRAASVVPPAAAVDPAGGAAGVAAPTRVRTILSLHAPTEADWRRVR